MICEITFHIELENKAALTALLANLKARGATLLEVLQEADNGFVETWKLNATDEEPTG